MSNYSLPLKKKRRFNTCKKYVDEKGLSILDKYNLNYASLRSGACTLSFYDNENSYRFSDHWGGYNIDDELRLVIKGKEHVCPYVVLAKKEGNIYRYITHCNRKIQCIPIKYEKDRYLKMMHEKTEKIIETLLESKSQFFFERGMGDQREQLSAIWGEFYEEKFFTCEKVLYFKEKIELVG